MCIRDSIETVWWLLNRLYDKDLLFKGKSIQPYSPKAGTGLSSHELNMPGAYREVKDVTVTAQFKLKDESAAKIAAFAPAVAGQEVHLIAWTTTPWTLPSNTALAVGEED